MEQVNIAEARERLEELIERAAAGETIVIARDGGKAVELVAAAPKAGAAKFDPERVRRRLEGQTTDTRPQQVIIDEWKRRERY